MLLLWLYWGVVCVGRWLGFRVVREVFVRGFVRRPCDVVLRVLRLLF